MLGVRETIEALVVYCAGCPGERFSGLCCCSGVCRGDNAPGCGQDPCADSSKTRRHGSVLARYQCARWRSCAFHRGRAAQHARRLRVCHLDVLLRGFQVHGAPCALAPSAGAALAYSSMSKVNTEPKYNRGSTPRKRADELLNMVEADTCHTRQVSVELVSRNWLEVS